MKHVKFIFLTSVILCCLITLFSPQAMAVNAGYGLDGLPDMSDFNPNTPPKLKGDTIKIAVIAAFSGPAVTTQQIGRAAVCKCVYH